MEQRIRIAILEDVIEIADQLRRIISNDPRLQLMGCYATAEAALKDDLPALNVNTFLVDLGLPGIDGIGFIQRAKQVCPEAHFLVHTISESGRTLMKALAAGAVGYILKGCSEEELCNGLQIAATGGSLLSPRMARQLIQFFMDVNPPKKMLTPTEINVLEKLKTGMRYADIAEANSVSPDTIHTHVKHIYRKLNVGNREDAVRNAMMYKIIGSDKNHK